MRSSIFFRLLTLFRIAERYLTVWWPYTYLAKSKYLYCEQSDQRVERDKASNARVEVAAVRRCGVMCPARGSSSVGGGQTKTYSK
mmetsp:Transcript_39340/g.100872  ORF Transcript_39340/g.100872 Transcript_39340/m.100872 type:complete len:85 (+) Transcript_39340:583-837(+)